jgi:hypothetical protein
MSPVWSVIPPFATRASLVACLTVSVAIAGCDGSTDPDHGPPASFAKHDGDEQTGVAGVAVARAPALRITDAENRPVPNVEVTFVVASGGGSVQGGVADTDGDGVATAGGWTLGALNGANTLTASTEGTVRATFAATGVSGAAAALVKVAGDNQTAAQGALVTVAPSVRVRDANNNPVAGVGVTFAVTGGAGSITGGVTTSGVDGIATIGSWRLGNAGQNALSATSTGLATVSFAAVTRGCVPVGTIAIGEAQSGTLATTDCRLGGYYMDWWTFTTESQVVVSFTQSATTFDAFLELYASDFPVATDDDASETTTDAAFRAILAPGTYNVAPSTFLQNATGDYTIAAATAAENIPGCAFTFVTPGITSSQVLESTDCQATETGVFYFDPFPILMRAGRQYTITMSSTVFDTWLELYTAAGGAPVAVNNDAVGTDARIVFTPTATNFFIIDASSNLVTTSGAYTLQIQESGGGAERPAAAHGAAAVAVPHNRGSMPGLSRKR